MTCDVGQIALSVGLNGADAMNNIVAMAITGLTHNQGYYRIRIKAGSAAETVSAQLLCGTLS